MITVYAIPRNFLNYLDRMNIVRHVEVKTVCAYGNLPAIAPIAFAY